jgi:hypothetical protein
MKWNKLIGWVLLLFATGFFVLQMGFLFISDRFQVEYIDNRLFYIFHMVCVICLALAILLLFRWTKTVKFSIAGVVIIFIIVQVVMLVNSDEKIKNITSISPDFKHILAIKENKLRGDAVYYRSHYVILARPKERLPFTAFSDFKVEWLANDVAAITYETTDHTIQQFIGTYGDRGGGIAYYYVAAEMYGAWQKDDVKVVSDTEGITVTTNGKAELFDWEHIHQFGTLAVVLKRDNEAVWTIALDENFVVHSDAAEPKVGHIILYEATMEEEQPIILDYEGY